MKAEIIESAEGCQLCTSWKHASAVCHQRRNGVITRGTAPKGTRCNKEHHKCFHNEAVGSIQGSSKRRTGSIMLQESGATHSIITHQLAHNLSLCSEQITIKVNLPDTQHKVLQRKSYRFYITDA